MKNIRAVFWIIIWVLIATGCDDEGGELQGNGGAENTVVLCSDGVDNDGDGVVDGADADCMSLATDTSVATDTAVPDEWITSWVSAQQETESSNMPPDPPGLANSTLRQLIHPSLGGNQMRVTFSNAYGDGPLTITSAGVAQSTGAGERSIVPATHTPMTFSGQAGVTIPVGATATTDSFDFQVVQFTNLSVSIALDGNVPSAVTGHPGSRTTSYLAGGSVIADPDLSSAETVKFTNHWYFLSAMDVVTTSSARSVVIMGDSITDGKGSTTNENNRWPNQLDKRLKQNPATQNISVLNQGVGGNCVTKKCAGPSFTDRFDSDVLGPIKVTHLILFGGINDLDNRVSSQVLIDAFTELANKATTAGITVIGATIMPCEGHNYFGESLETRRQEINTWIRTTELYDAVIDFDEIAHDPAQPTRLKAEIDGGDGLHPSVEGHQIMADAVNLALFSM